MWTDGPVLKCPDKGEWLAVVKVDSDGNVEPKGYVRPGTMRLVADTLSELHAKVPETGWHSADQVAAWEDFVNWTDVVAELGERQQ